MAQQNINVGTAPNAGDGDSLRDAFTKAESNFGELYSGKAPKGLATNSGLTSTGPSLLGRATTGLGALEELSITATKNLLNLGNVENTSDANKPISIAVQSALDNKEDLLLSGTTSQYYRGDKTWQTLNRAAVGLSNVDNTSDANKPISTAVQSALDDKADANHNHGVEDILLSSQRILGRDSGGAGAGEELTGVQVKSIIGLSNVDNTSDANKPISNATQTALDLKANTVHTHVIGDVTGLQGALDGKSNTGHTHTIAQVINLQTTLDQKSDTTHSHDITTLTGFTTFSNSKADTVHTHTISSVTGLEARLVSSAKGYLETPASNSRIVTISDATWTVGSSSVVRCGVGTTNSVTLNILHNGVTVGQVDFSAADDTGTITWTGSAPTVVCGDVLEVVFPSSVDATMAKVVVVFRN